MSSISNSTSDMLHTMESVNHDNAPHRLEAAKARETQTVGADPQIHFSDKKKAYNDATLIGKEHLKAAEQESLTQGERIAQDTAQLRDTWIQTSQTVRQTVSGSLLKTSDYLRDTARNLRGILEKPAALGRSMVDVLKAGWSAPQQQRPLTALGFYSRNLAIAGAVTGIVGTVALLSMSTVTYVSVPGLLLTLGVVCACDLGLSMAYRARARAQEPLSTPLTTAPVHEGEALSPDEQISRVRVLVKSLDAPSRAGILKDLENMIDPEDETAKLTREAENLHADFPKRGQGPEGELDSEKASVSGTQEELQDVVFKELAQADRKPQQASDTVQSPVFSSDLASDEDVLSLGRTPSIVLETDAEFVRSTVPMSIDGTLELLSEQQK